MLSLAALATRKHDLHASERSVVKGASENVKSKANEIKLMKKKTNTSQRGGGGLIGFNAQSTVLVLSRRVTSHSLFIVPDKSQCLFGEVWEKVKLDEPGN